MKRFSRIAAAVALAIAGSGAAAAVAASPPPDVAELPVYLALGDSMVAGQNSAAPEDDADAFWHAVEAWNRNGYVTPFAKYLKHEIDCQALPLTAKGSADCGQLDVVNLGRSAVPDFDDDGGGLPGVTAQAVIDEQLEYAEELIGDRNGDDNPRNDVEVITLTVGGNEIFDAFTAALQAQDMSLVTQAIADFAEDYTQILARLREAGGPDLPILTMTYSNPLWYCDTGLPPEQVPVVATLADQVLEQLPIGPGVAGFNGLIEAISGAYGAVPAETYGELGEGDFFDCKHPNTDGYAQVAEAFEEAWESIE